MYDINSRYHLIAENPSLIQENLEKMNVPYTTTYVKENESIELVSQRVYNNPSLWWLLCRANGILNPRVVTTGMKLIVPDLTTVDFHNR